MHTQRSSSGFTIVELLIVIVIIAILAAITIVAYNGIQDRSRMAKINNDLAQLSKAIMLARESTGKMLYQMTGSTYTAAGCVAKDAGTDLATLSRTDACWTRYAATLAAINTAAGTALNPDSLVDPWGAPYFIDENEGENGGCTADRLGYYRHPFDKGYVGLVSVPFSGYRPSGC